MTPKQRDVSECSLAAARRVGVYVGLDLTLSEFRARPCAELVEGCQKSCPLDPQDYGVCLITFRESLRECLKDRGYPKPYLYLALLCATKDTSGGEVVPWTWGDWCDYTAEVLQ